MDENEQIIKECDMCQDFMRKCGSMLTNPEDFLLLGYIYASQKEMSLNNVYF